MSVKKRGRAIPLRFILTILIILLQLFLFGAGLTSLSDKFLGVYRAAQIASVITVIYIVNSRGNQSYKILWIIFILLVPVIGISAYLLWGGGRIFPHIKKRMTVCSQKYLALLEQDDNVIANLHYNDLFHIRQAEFLRRESGFPIYKNTSSKFYSPGEALMQDLLNLLKNAKKYIYIEFFILSEGHMWDEIFKILKERAESGVEIKIIFDDFGSVKYQSKNFIKDIRKAGISVSVFNPITPSINIFMNNRNHRKIIIIDGEYALTGGMNIADEYINKIEKHGYWMDSSIILCGKSVNSFLAMFCGMWEFITGEEIDMLSHISNSFPEKSDGFYIPYCDDPLNDSNPAEGIYMQILNNAQRYVYIATPYLILDNNMTNTICLAAKSGVDVRIVTPSVPDKWYVHPVTQYNYAELLESGVRIFEYTPGFIHSKLFLSDDNTATVGTVNMDYRSFYFHFECGVWMSHSNTTDAIKENFNSIFEQSKEITLEEWKKRPIRYRLRQQILHLFAPLM